MRTRFWSTYLKLLEKIRPDDKKRKTSKSRSNLVKEVICHDILTEQLCDEEKLRKLCLNGGNRMKSFP